MLSRKYQIKETIVTVTADERIGEVRSLFRKYKFLALPVVDEENHLRGVISFRSVLEVLAPDAG